MSKGEKPVPIEEAPQANTEEGKVITETHLDGARILFGWIDSFYLSNNNFRWLL